MGHKRWIVYGANGYTGTLLAREAKRQGLNPVLAGRTESAILALARELDCECRIFPLDDFHTIARHLNDVDLILHCAGPFSATSALMVEACLSSQTHYLDITGEIEVFEHIHSCHERAKDMGIVLCPGVGFDVIPTDCVAAVLQRALPDAISLALGFDSRSGFSPGTARTSVEGLAQGGKIRREGKIISVPLAYKVRQIDFGDGEKNAMTIPWGDIATAYYTTGIPHIETYLPASPRLIARLRMLNSLRPLMAIRLVQGLLKGVIAKVVKGPDEGQRQRFPTYVWGEVSNASGEKRVARLKTANGYDLTVSGALTVVDKILDDPPPGGYYTPSRLMGADFVVKLPDSGEIQITDN